MGIFKHNGPGPLFELKKTEYLTGDDEGGEEVPSVLIGRYKTEAGALKRARKLELDPDMHYIRRICIIHHDGPGYWPMWSDDEDYGTYGIKYLHEFP